MNSKITLVVATIIGILVFAIIIYSLVDYSKKSLVNEKNILKLGKMNSSNYRIIPACEILRPKDGFTFTYGFQMKIENYFEDYGFWKHVFHRGTPIDTSKPLSYMLENDEIDNWDNLTSDYPYQSIGVWLHPTKNHLRIVLTTEDSNTYDYLDHANASTIYENQNAPLTDLSYPKKIINTFDINDVPVNTPFNVGLIVNKNTITVYFNGILRHIFSFRGTIVDNNASLYFHALKTYNGYLNNFHYYPRAVSESEIKKLSKK